MIDKTKKYCYTLFLIFIFMGCTSTTQSTAVSGNNTSIASLAPIETSTFARPTPINTVIPITATPYPTLISSDVTQFINNLASTDEVCSFPCWGGIVPGKTNWNDINAFLESLAEVSKHSPSSPKGFAVYIPLSNQYPSDLLWISIYLDESNVVKYINGSRYSLPINQLFNKYGKPNQIYFFALDVLPSDSIEQFELVFSYEKQGFFVVYNGEVQNQALLEICSSNINGGPYFWIWDPQDNEAMSTIVNSGSSYRFHDNWSQYQEISIMTKGNVTVDLFYKTYFDSANVDACIQIPSP